MKVGQSINLANLFNKTVDDSDDITEGAAKLFYPAADKTKVADLPPAPNAYLEIDKVSTNPGTGTEGEVIYNTTDSAFYMWNGTAWVKVLFAMIEV